VTDPALVLRNQPDVLNIHFEFLRPCDRCDSVIAIEHVKVGAAASTLELRLSQKGVIRVIALATSTNFDRPLGPTVSHAWSLLPAPKPVPDFGRVEAHQPEQNWLPLRIAGELIPITSRMLTLYPRGGFVVDGIWDAWNRFDGAERMDATYLTVMADLFPSMSDTLLRNEGVYDSHVLFQKTERGAEKNPGVPALLTNSLADAMRASIWNSTTALDIEFKRRPPNEGLRWVFTRALTKMLHGGRMDIDVTICNEEMELLCVSHHVVLVLEAQKRFRRGKAESVL
jgi:hypothetical protein